MEKLEPSQDLTVTRSKTPYRSWVEQEGIPIHKGFYIEDLRTLEVKPWPRRDTLGAYILLEGTEEQTDAYVLEVPAGKTTAPERHLFEEIIYVLEGSGATTVWVEGAPRQTFEWHSGSLFSPPMNAWYQHFNGSGTQPARLMAVTTAPVMINLLRETDFVFGNDHVFRDRYAGEEGYFSARKRSLGKRLWETNFVSDVRSFELEEYLDRGRGNFYTRFEMSNNSLLAHVSEFPVGTYKKAHSHGAGAHVIMLGGTGYSLMWPKGEKPRKFDWHDGSVIVPPDQWFHQHFNTGNRQARYLALRWGSLKHPMGRSRRTKDIEKVYEQIEYEDQDPEIHRLFESECARMGVTVAMESVGK